MTKTPRCTGKGHSIKCAALWCTVSCLFGILASIVGPTATILAEQTHSTEADLAPMLGMGGICTLLTGLPSGWIFDFMPRQGNRLVAATLLVEAAAYTLMTLCTSVLELTVVYAVIGLVFNVVSTGLNVMVIWEFTTHAPQHLPLVLNLLSASFGLGGIIAPQLVNLASIASPAGGVAAYYAVSTAAAVMAVAVGVTRSPTPPGSHLALAQSEGQHKEQRTEEPALLVLFANVSIELGYAGWVYVYARDVGGVSDYAAESLCSVYWMAFTGGRLLAAVLVTIIPCGTVLLWSMPLAVVGAAWPLLAPGPTATIASVLLVGLGASAGFPTTLGMTAECIPLDGHLNGLISTVTGLSITLLPSAIPFMAKRDPQRGFAWLMIATLAMALMQYVCLVQLVCASKGITRRAAIAAAAAGSSSPGEADPEAPRSAHATHVVHDEALTTPLLSGA
ncbi:major facilitator superfamily domain-containing protein [Haematococcus lacustris]